MSAPRDCPSTMRTHLPLDDRTVEDLLAGRVAHDRTDLGDVARLLAHLQSAADGAVPPPNPVLARILAEGLPADVATSPEPATTAPHATATTGHWRPRLAYLRGAPATISAVTGGLVAKIAALGVAGKTALVLTTAAAVAAGAAATDLPTTIGDALRRGGEHAPADRPHDAELGEPIPDDATHPGVHQPDAADHQETDDGPGREPSKSVGDDEDRAGDDEETAPAAGGLGPAPQERADTPASPQPGAERRPPREQPDGPPASPRRPSPATPRGPEPARSAPPDRPTAPPTEPDSPDADDRDGPDADDRDGPDADDRDGPAVLPTEPAPDIPPASPPPTQAPSAPRVAPTEPSR